MEDFLTFRRMITPVIIQVVFWLLVGLSVLVGVVSLIGGLAGDQAVSGIFGCFISVFIGPILIRIYCELLILFFRMHDELVSIKDALSKRG